jgi:hypothetical protein
MEICLRGRILGFAAGLLMISDDRLSVIAGLRRAAKIVRCAWNNKKRPRFDSAGPLGSLIALQGSWIVHTQRGLMCGLLSHAGSNPTSAK